MKKVIFIINCLALAGCLCVAMAAGGTTPTNVPANASHARMPQPVEATSAASQKVAPPAKGERIVLIGNGLAERDVYYSRLETGLHLRYPDEALFVRNMGRPGDTPGFRPHPARVSQWAFPAQKSSIRISPCTMERGSSPRPTNGWPF